MLFFLLSWLVKIIIGILLFLLIAGLATLPLLLYSWMEKKIHEHSDN